MVECYHIWSIDKKKRTLPSWSIDEILDEAARYVLDHEKDITEKPYGFGGGEGSDAVSVSSNKSAKILKYGDLEIKVEDQHVSRSYGTYSVDWSEEDFRNISIYLKDIFVIHASKLLGGKSGHSGVLSGTTKETIKPDEKWDITFKKSTYLKKIKKLLKEVKAKYE